MLFKSLQSLLKSRKTAHAFPSVKNAQKPLFPKADAEVHRASLVMGSVCSLCRERGDSGEAGQCVAVLAKHNPEDPKKGKSLVPDLPPPTRVVAFTAKLNVAHSTPDHAGVLKLVAVLANEGDAYNPDTGLFTCPLEGLYHFAVHASMCGRAQCAIYKNGESLASVYHTSLPDKCSQVATTSSTVQLCEGDTVWVNLWCPGRHEIIATEDNDTVFVGFHLG